LSVHKKPAHAGEQETFRDPIKRRAWVIYQLKLQGLNLTSLARETGVSQPALSAALLSPSSDLEEVIAAAVGVPVKELFPERFAANGRRLHLVRGPNRSRRAPLHNVESAGRA